MYTLKSIPSLNRLTTTVATPILPAMLPRMQRATEIMLTFEDLIAPKKILTFNLYNSTGDLINVSGPIPINASSDLPWNYTIPSGLDDGNYTLNFTITDNANNANKVAGCGNAFPAFSVQERNF